MRGSSSLSLGRWGYSWRSVDYRRRICFEMENRLRRSRWRPLWSRRSWWCLHIYQRARYATLLPALDSKCHCVTLQANSCLLAEHQVCLHRSYSSASFLGTANATSTRNWREWVTPSWRLKAQIMTTGAVVLRAVALVQCQPLCDES
jgi:hypothetical protein